MVKQYAKHKTIFIERDGKILTWTWKQYYQDSMAFAKAVIKCGATDRSGVAIMGFNSPEWIFAFAGGLMANSLVTGVYITNEADACLYQINHSETEVVCVETKQHLERIMVNIDKMP